MMLQHVLALGIALQPHSAQASQLSAPLSLSGHTQLFRKPLTMEGKKWHQSERRAQLAPVHSSGFLLTGQRSLEAADKVHRISIADKGSGEAPSLSVCSHYHRHAAATTAPYQ